jgi:hypothetical protein
MCAGIGKFGHGVDHVNFPQTWVLYGTDEASRQYLRLANRLLHGFYNTYDDMMSGQYVIGLIVGSAR